MIEASNYPPHLPNKLKSESLGVREAWVFVFFDSKDYSNTQPGLKNMGLGDKLHFSLYLLLRCLLTSSLILRTRGILLVTKAHLLDCKDSSMLVTQSCPTLCEPMDCSLPSSTLCPWDFPGKNTRVDSCSLLQ